jgi:hypothetical protein
MQKVPNLLSPASLGIGHYLKTAGKRGDRYGGEYDLARAAALMPQATLRVEAYAKTIRQAAPKRSAI